MDIIIIVSAAVIFVIALTVFFNRSYVKKTYDAIDSVLDRIFSKETVFPADANIESRLSKLTFKARRITDVLVSEAARNNEEKETIQGFISDMSHQMKTPLSGISMYADLLLEGGLTVGEQREFHTRIKTSSEKLQWMTDSLIKMSRLEIGAIQLTPSRESIRQTITDAVGSVCPSKDSIRALAALASVTFRWVFILDAWASWAENAVFMESLTYSASLYLAVKKSTEASSS